MKKVNSTTKEDTDREESDTDAIGRIDSIMGGGGGAVGSSSTDVEVEVGIRPRNVSNKSGPNG